MKITIYELLGLIKDDKAPKKIKYNGDIYILESNAIFEFFLYKTIDYNKFNTDGERLGKALFLDNHHMHLYDEVEIIEEQKKIKKLDLDGYYDDNSYCECKSEWCSSEDVLVVKINEIIDEVNKLKEE